MTLLVVVEMLLLDGCSVVEIENQFCQSLKRKFFKLFLPSEAGLLKFLPVSGGLGLAVSLCER